METTTLIAKLLGPVLILRGLSIVRDREHFRRMLRGLDEEIATLSFSFFPIALLMACIALLALHLDTSSVAAVLIRVMAWGGIIKGSALILVPDLMVAKAHALERAGILNVVLAYACSPADTLRGPGTSRIERGGTQWPRVGA